ncbi:WbuC family cupin fold metalloprotein [Alkalitalea saponilacus]|uniref:Cupin fold metalloprotein, WbuC family n=1 Tax=Alkalitalea saponilacus TaxID=889453 RepID=A0A1T5HQI0_9BACT|nr:WbuC family cupin fold metalloprotein [Alkalitalea saponilacus]ASB48439.1 cupin fold metalloprotein, WbuC family [Alkalitalea saponilacus]SKC22928.1 cupin fold metalloprotein, WbuC family [Alkalitalea saponilacus]
MILINRELLDEVSSQAKSSPRLRKNYNFHSSLEDPINRMLNAFEPDTYVRPHMHKSPDKREVFIVLRGKLAMFFFGEDGIVENVIILDALKGNYGVEIPPGVWHAVFCMETGTIVYEIKDGPYNVTDDKHFAPWAPEEGSPEAINYLNELKKHLPK